MIYIMCVAFVECSSEICNEMEIGIQSRIFNIFDKTCGWKDNQNDKRLSSEDFVI